MDDAARYIQRRWNWFQTEGRFLAKKGKKKGRGKKKKKKGWATAIEKYMLCLSLKKELVENHKIVFAFEKIIINLHMLFPIYLVYEKHSFYPFYKTNVEFNS